jgi:putative sigma-54 modulation protein
MRITVRATSAWLTEIARRRFDFALGRFRGRVHSVTVRVADINGPRGGVDKRCRVTVQLQSPKRAIVVEDLDPDAAVAIDRGADRAARTVARLVDTTTNWRTKNNGRQEVRGRSGTS